MIAPRIVAEVRRLLAVGGLGQRKIAELAGVSRGTVRSIASGTRPDYESLHRPRDDDREESLGPAVRCPGCGGMAIMPCRLCSVRKAMAVDPRRAMRHPADSLGAPPDLDLRPDHRARYEEIRAVRLEIQGLGIRD